MSRRFLRFSILHNYPPILCIVHKYRRFAWADTTQQNRRAGRICLGKYVSRRRSPSDMPWRFGDGMDTPPHTRRGRPPVSHITNEMPRRFGGGTKAPPYRGDVKLHPMPRNERYALSILRTAEACPYNFCVKSPPIPCNE